MKASSSITIVYADFFLSFHHYQSPSCYQNQTESRQFLIWKAQLVPYLRGQHLLGYVDGTTPIPPQMINQSSSSGETS